MPGLDPGIHLEAALAIDHVDGRIKSGHDNFDVMSKLP
jgi:hypothetical protein